MELPCVILHAILHNKVQIQMRVIIYHLILQLELLWALSVAAQISAGLLRMEVVVHSRVVLLSIT